MKYYWSTHSLDPAVYHDKIHCPDGERIKPENKQWGFTPPAGRRKCEECPKVAY